MRHPVRYGLLLGVAIFVVLLLLGILVPGIWGPVRFSLIAFISVVNGWLQGLAAKWRRLNREAMPDLAGPSHRWGRRPK